jgi:hypothetical protein
VSRMVPAGSATDLVIDDWVRVIFPYSCVIVSFCPPHLVMLFVNYIFACLLLSMSGSARGNRWLILEADLISEITLRCRHAHTQLRVVKDRTVTQIPPYHNMRRN